MAKSTIEIIQVITELLYELDPKQLEKVHSFIKAYRNSVDLQSDYKNGDSHKDYEECAAAWIVIRNAPGKIDDGVKLGPFLKESEADEWVDDSHTKVPVYY